MSDMKLASHNNLQETLSSDAAYFCALGNASWTCYLVHVSRILLSIPVFFLLLIFVKYPYIIFYILIFSYILQYKWRLMSICQAFLSSFLKMHLSSREFMLPL